MKSFRFIVIALSLFFLTSCAGFHNLAKSPIGNSPNVELSQNNFHVVKQGSASASCTYIFGIGGLSGKAMRQNAIADMMEKANLTGSQSVINIVTKVSRKMITPFYVETTMTVHGTVIEFDGPSYDYTVELPVAK